MRPVQNRLLRQTVAVTLALGFAACSDTNDPVRPGVQALFTTPTGLLTANPPQIFVGAGDISSCSNTGDEATAKLLDAIPNPATVYNIGDDVYDNGTTSEFANCYNPTWGRHKYRTKPTPGNHEYNSSGAAPYYAYFGASAGPSGRGYYSYDLGAWHIISLNSNVSSSSGSAQDTWLRADLAAHPNQCTLAYYHHPLYSSTATYSSSRGLVNALYAYHADLILNGHRHYYERLKPLDPTGKSDPTNGVREIIAGMGGIGGGSPNSSYSLSEASNGSTFGVLKLYLYDDSYAWKFVPVAGKTYTDSGSTACHSSGGGGGGGVSAANSTVSASPAAITAGGSPSTITVTVKDGSGNPISGATVVLSATGTGNTLTQPSSTTTSSGVATGTLASTVTESKTVSATANGVSITQTATVTVGAAAAETLAFTVQPSSTGAGATITPAVQVQIRDQFGNAVTSATNNVTLALGTNPSGATLSGTKTVAAVAGVATFSTLSVNNPGTGYTLIASATGLSNATSNAFNITATPTQLAFFVQPSNATTGAAISPPVQVEIQDASGNRVSTATNSVTVAIGTNPGGGTLSGTKTVSAVAGVATFSTLSINNEGTGYTLTAASAGLSGATSNAFNVVAPSVSASLSTVTASPGSITTTGTSTITVTVKDGSGNPMSGVTVVLGASGTGNALTQPTGTTDLGGVATGTLSSTVAETKIVSATANGTAITQTASVTVTVGPPPGTITHALLTSGHDVNNQQVYTTASIAPAPNALVTVAVLTHQSSSAAPSPTLTGGGMASWTVVASVAYNGTTPLDRLTIYRAMSASPGSGPITITSSVTVSNCQWIVSQWSGVDGSGTNGSGAIVQTGSASGTSVNGLTVNLAAFASANDVAYGAFGAASATAVISAGSGFTTIDQQPSGEGTVGDVLAERAVNLPAVAATWSSKNAGALGVEIKAGP
jgi:hypothetical protein